MDENEEIKPGHTTTEVEDALVSPPARLHRSGSHRIVAGVAGGVGDRFDIDPNIVRVVFVVLCVFWGLGAAIYLAMWALIPLSPRDPSAPEVPADVLPTRRWLRYALLAGVVVVAVIFVSSAGGAPQFGQGLAWPWLGFLVVLAIITLRRPARRLNVQRLVALLFLVALSTVILLSGVFLAVLASTDVPIRGGNGLRVYQPTTLGQVQPIYRTGFGSTTLNLSHVDFPKGGFTVTASVAVGYLRIEIPANVVVDLRTHVGIGTVQYYLGDGGSSETFSSVPANLSPMGQRVAPHLTLNADIGFGRIDFVRAGSRAALRTPTG